MKIKKLEIRNFKFFDEVEALDFTDKNGNAKNILIYGENGSGKSTIYWALYTLLQSSKKDEEKIKKYFTSTDDSSLVNVYADENDSKIELVNEEEEKFIISKNNITIHDENETIENSLYTSDFINYKYLFRFFNFLHRDKIDLFNLFEYEILHFLNTGDGINLYDLWKELLILVDNKPRIRAEKTQYDNLQNILKQFNEALILITSNLNEPANGYLRDKFGYDKVKLELTTINGVYDNQEFNRPKINIELSVLKNGNYEMVLKPQSYFNEAKLTAIALSIRLAITQIKLKNSPLKLLVLDDLLLSLDMSNRDMVLDVLLNDTILREYQKIILTHDRSFFEMAKHKFNYMQRGEWKYFEMFVDSTRDFERPFINKESLGYMEKAEKYFVLNEYEVAGSFLRKEAEHFCKGFLSKKEECSFDLGQLISKSIEFVNNANLDDTLFKKLDHHRKFVLNPRSHDNYNIPTYKSEIENALDTLKELRKIRIEPFLERGKVLEFELVTTNGADTYKFEIKLDDDFRVLTIEGEDSAISKGKIIYWVMKNDIYTKGTKDETEAYDTTTLKKFYDYNYEKSDKTKSPNFWETILIKDNGEIIQNLL